MSGPAAAIISGTWASGLPTASPTLIPTPAPVFSQWLISYIQPLSQWREQLLGDPGQITSMATTWRAAEASLVEVTGQLRAASRELGELDGRAIRVLTLRYEDLVPTVEDASGWARAVAAAAELAASISAGVLVFIDDFLQELGRFAKALFAFTFNPLDKIEDVVRFADAAYGLVRSGGRLIQSMFDAYAKLLQLIASLDTVIDHALTQMRETIARMAPLIAGAAGLVLGGPLTGLLAWAATAAASDMFIESGPVTRHSDEQALIAEHGWVGEEMGVADLVGANGLTDDAGGADATAIDIKLVRDADGNEHWVVSLPSTLQWLEAMGSGAMNDGPNNLALMLMDNPALKTQYERAVLQAMREAGMSPGDSVVFTGFSQGGIMAANLAADPTLPYNTIGVLTHGSPVGTFDIPAHIPVVAIEHVTDPVAKLDGHLLPVIPTASHIHRVVLPDPTLNPLNIAGDHGSHNAANYSQSIRDHRPDLEQQYAWMGGEVIDHQIFSGVER